MTDIVSFLLAFGRSIWHGVNIIRKGSNEYAEAKETVQYPKEDCR